MSAGSPSLVDLLEQRLRIVQETAAAQSRNVLHRQLGGGTEFEILGIEQEIATTGWSHALATALANARERLREANATVAACDADCVALELRLEELDRRIAAGR